MTTPRDDIAGLSERLRCQHTMSMFVTKDSLIACLNTEREEAATQLAALSARVAEMTSLLAISEDLRRKVIDVAEQWQARALRAEQERDNYERLYHNETVERLRAEQERDEAYERAAKEASNRADPIYGSEEMNVARAHTATIIKRAIRRLASGPEKEKKE